MASESIGAIWKRTAKSSGKEYLSIVFTRADGTKSEFVAFENDKGDNPSRPDYKIFKSEPRQNNSPPPQRAAPVPQRPANNGRPNTANFKDDVPGAIDDSTIPF